MHNTTLQQLLSLHQRAFNLEAIQKHRNSEMINDTKFRTVVFVNTKELIEEVTRKTDVDDQTLRAIMAFNMTQSENNKPIDDHMISVQLGDCMRAVTAIKVMLEKKMHELGAV